MKPDLYIYKAFVTNVYDGDTITCNIDLGFDITIHERKIRLFDIDTPEIRGSERKEGLVSRDYLRSLILNKTIYIETQLDKSGKYGRLLGTIYLIEEGDSIGENLNEKLITEGYAKRYGK